MPPRSIQFVRSALASLTLAIVQTLALTPLLAQSALPPTAPTALTPSQNATSEGLPKVSTPHRALVTLTDGLLNVRANDSSLNQILHSISRLTGMSITGGVTDQRVFGNYGPDTPAAILAILLDGTGTNMLLREGDASKPVELVLTPRTGGPTPPNPNAAGFDDTGDDRNPPDRQPDIAAERRRNAGPQNHPDGPPPPIGFPGQAQAPIQSTSPAQVNSVQQERAAPTQQLAPPQQQQTAAPEPIPQPANNVLGSSKNSTPTASQIPTTNSVPTDALPTPATTVSTDPGIVDTPNPPAPDSTTGTTPAASTPESIYQQLLKLQQQQPKPANTPETPK